MICLQKTRYTCLNTFALQKCLSCFPKKVHSVAPQSKLFLVCILEISIVYLKNSHRVLKIWSLCLQKGSSYFKYVHHGSRKCSTCIDNDHVLRMFIISKKLHRAITKCRSAIVHPPECRLTFILVWGGDSLGHFQRQVVGKIFSSDCQLRLQFPASDAARTQNKAASACPFFSTR